MQVWIVVDPFNILPNGVNDIIGDNGWFMIKADDPINPWYVS